ncbi:hypothetical protein BDZ94DRAFT_1310882, partial [Collybia nuda]
PPASPDAWGWHSDAPARPVALKCDYVRTSRPIASGLVSTPSAHSPTSPTPGTTPLASSDVWGRRSDTPARPVALKRDSARTSRPIASGLLSTPLEHSPTLPAPATTPPASSDAWGRRSDAPAHPLALKHDSARTSRPIVSGPPSTPSAHSPTSPAPRTTSPASLDAWGRRSDPLFSLDSLQLDLANTTLLTLIDLTCTRSHLPKKGVTHHKDLEQLRLYLHIRESTTCILAEELT